VAEDRLRNRIIRLHRIGRGQSRFENERWCFDPNQILAYSCLMASFTQPFIRFDTDVVTGIQVRNEKTARAQRPATHIDQFMVVVATLLS